MGWFTADDLVAYCHEAGFVITRDQLARWHRKGVIPSPKRDHQSGRPGTVSMYPPGTLQTLLAVCRLQTGRTPFDEISWSLWWSGNEADMQDARIFMDKVCKDLDHTIDLVRSGTSETTKSQRVPTEIRRVLSNATSLRGPLGWARRSVGKSDWPRFVDFTFDALQGHPPDLSKEDRNMIDRAFHIRGAYEVRAQDQPIRSVQDHAETFAWFAKFMSRPLYERLSEITDDELLEARDSVKRLVTFLGSFGDVMKWLFRPDGLGYGFVARIVNFFAEAPSRQVFLTVLVHAFSTDPDFGVNVAELDDLTDQWKSEHLPNWEKLRLLADGVPELSQVINPRSMRRAFTSQAGLERHIERVREVREENAVAIDALIMAHPEVFPSATIEHIEEEE